MEPTLKEVNAMYRSLCVFKRNIKEDVERVLGKLQDVGRENTEVYRRKGDLFVAIWAINEQFEHFDDLYRYFWGFKEDKIMNVRECVDELKMSIAMKEQKLESLVRGDHDFRSPVKLVYSKIDADAKLETETEETSPKPGQGGEVEKLESGDAGIVASPEGDMNLDASGSGDSGNGGAAADTSGHGKYLIRNFNHLCELKAYLSAKRNIKKVVKSLTTPDKKLFIEALTRFGVTCLDDLAEPFPYLRAEMFLTLEQVLSHFEDCCVDCEVPTGRKTALSQGFQNLLKSFVKKYPADSSGKTKGGFFKRLLCGTHKEVQRIQDTPSGQLEITKEMLRIQTLRRHDLEKSLKDIDTWKQAACDIENLFPNRSLLLNLVLDDIKTSLENDAFYLIENCKMQDVEFFELKKTMNELEDRIA